MMAYNPFQRPHCRPIATGIDTAPLKAFCARLPFDAGCQFPDGRHLAASYTADEMLALSVLFQDAVEPHIGRPEVGLIWLLRMGPGDELPLHTDHEVTPILWKYPARMHLVISASPGCRFYIADETIEQREGDLWQISGVTHVLHGARNDSCTDRLLGVFDVADPDRRIAQAPALVR
jgi:hypothetical protein